VRCFKSSNVCFWPFADRDFGVEAFGDRTFVQLALAEGQEQLVGDAVRLLGVGSSE